MSHTVTRSLGPCFALALGVWLTGPPASGPVAGSLPEGLREGLAQREYAASANALGLQAPNRAHNLRSYFSANGVRVNDRTASGSPELVALRLARIGRGDASAAVPPGEVGAHGARVEIRRGELVEWYENSPRGLEQGFTVSERPPGAGQLFLELELEGAQAVAHGSELELHAATGRRLRYAELKAQDAAGRAVPAHMELRAPSVVRLVVADADAAYPLTIDPLLGSADDTQLLSDQAGAQLGFSLASAGDVNGDGYADLIVGANLYDDGESNEGAAFVFLGSASGIADGNSASAAAELQSNQANAQLGRVVAGAGDVNGDGYADVIVGARFYDAPHVNEGAAFIFLGSASGIADGNPLTAATQLEGDQMNAQFGSGVDGAGDVNGDGYADVIVGSWFYTDPDTQEGAAFVFLGGSGGIADGGPASAATVLESNQAGGFFGIAVAGAGDVNADGYADVIVGARDYDDPETNEGAAFVFLGSATGIASGAAASASAKLESDQAGAQFGVAVAGAGDLNGDGYADVIVGAPMYDAGESNEGAAFVFLGGPAGVATSGAATAATRLEANQVGAQLGSAVAGAGDVNGDGYADVIAGATFYDDGETDEGAAFVFLGSAAGIPDGGPASEYARLESNQANAQLGAAVTGAGDVNGDGYADVMAGAALYDGASADMGAAFVFLGANQGIVDGSAASAATKLYAKQAGALFGSSVAGAGDVNGDGYGDVIVGAPYFDHGENNEGAAFVFLGSPTGIALNDPNAPAAANAAAMIESNQDSGTLGFSVAGAGDVNGDGYGDVIVGAHQYNTPLVNAGLALIFHGGPTGIASGSLPAAATVLQGEQAGAVFGWTVAGAGDVNGDGYSDVVVGAPYYANGGLSQSGAAFVFRGSPSGVASGTSTTAAAKLYPDQAQAQFGYSVAGAGDVNGDGFADVIVGSYLYDDPDLDEGAAFLYLGSANGVESGTGNARFEGNQSNAFFGWTVAGAGDVNGDGYGDVIVGALDYVFVPGEGSGAAFIYLGGPSGIPSGSPTSADTQLTGFASAFDLAVAGAGDVNGDGYADVIVGAFGARVFPGSAFGIPDGSSSSAAATIADDGSGTAQLGYSVAGAGDVNSDGFADIVVGANYLSNGFDSEGGAFVFLGNGNRHGRHVVTEQHRSLSDFSLVAPYGLAGGLDSFVGRFLRVSPMGRVQLRTELELCQHGSAFGSPGCVTRTTGGQVSGSPGGDYLLMPVSGLASGTLYHWRARTLYQPSTAGTYGSLAPPKPAHGPWRRIGAQLVEGDLRTLQDVDLDGVADPLDNCSTVFNASQSDADADGVGDACDNCVNVANPRLGPSASAYLVSNPWATLTGGQRDDDHDGYGNKCDADFTPAGAFVGSPDLAQFRASNGKSRLGDTCGTSGLRPCAIFDLDEAATFISSGDLNQFRLLIGKAAGPKCSTCPLPCQPGSAGTCGPIP